MEYFELSQASDPKTVGVTDGAGQAWFDENFLERHQWFDKVFYETELAGKEWWKLWAKPTAFAQELDLIPMEKKAKHTDYIKFPRLMRGFMVNSRLRDLLEQAHLPNHKFLKSTFNQNGKIIDDYWWFVYDMETGENTVDFAESNFTMPRHKSIDSGNLRINSYEDYLDFFYKAGEPAKATKLVFNRNFDNELDIFGTQFLSNKPAYVSEKLLKKWEKANITGYATRSYDEVKMRAERLNNLYCLLGFPSLPQV